MMTDYAAQPMSLYGLLSAGLMLAICIGAWWHYENPRHRP